MLIIFVLSDQSTLPSAPSGLLDTVLKKTAHMLEYGGLLVLLWRAFSWRVLSGSRPDSRTRLLVSLVSAFVVTVLYAASDEFHQTFVAGRNGRLSDVAIDSVGAALAAFGVWIVKRPKGKETIVEGEGP
jgi:VanZ family protein